MADNSKNIPENWRQVCQQYCLRHLFYYVPSMQRIKYVIVNGIPGASLHAEMKGTVHMPLEEQSWN